MQSDEKPVRFFARHFVRLCGMAVTHDIDGNETKQYLNYSAFIISYEGHWTLVTAGHIIEDIEKLYAAGGRFADVALDDSAAADATCVYPLPFDYQSAPKMHIFDEENGIDIGLIALSNFYCQGLIKNNIEPLSEQSWQIDTPAEFDAYWLFGLPAERVIDQGNGGKVGYVMLHLNLVEDIPVDMRKPFPRFYAQITDKGSLKSIEGMSGGPIFGIKAQADDRQFYWLVAVQSGWRSDIGLVTACPINAFFECIRSEMAAKGLIY
ncbi:hypothetical protein [Capsulimonas corticalis]|nr:hypothetical protein [Capsulimonas corticalis]